jgi:aspartate aminotransferase-like enzyme
MFVQNETATGMRHPVAEMRAGMNLVKELLVDLVSQECGSCSADQLDGGLAVCVFPADFPVSKCE